MRSRTVLLALVAALLAGCAVIPTTGEVHEGDGRAGEPGQIIPQGSLPGQDAAPEEILRGFLAATPAGVNSAYDISREYLTYGARTSWEPWREVTVYRSDPQFAIVSAQTGRVVYAVSMSVAASVDESGLFTETGSQAERVFEFVLELDGQGQWRIDELPDAIWLNQSNFANLYRATTLYHPTLDRRYLVPDVRWFVREGAPMLAVRTLLEAGPAPWLRDAVSTGHIGSTRLEGDSVVVDLAGNAVVELTPSFMNLSREEQALLIAQLEAVLVRGSSGISAVRVQVQGVPISVPADESLLRDPAPEGSLLAIRDDGRVVALGTDGLTEVEGVADLSPDETRSLAQGAAAFPLVALSGPRRLVNIRGDEISSPWVEGRRLVPPSVDPHGWVWTSPERSDGVLPAARSTVESVGVYAGWLEGREIRSLRVSRDGARVVIASVGEGDVSVDVAAVIRDELGRPQRIGPPHQVGAVLTEAREVAWVDEVTLAVLGTVAGGTGTAVQIVPVSGLTTSRGAPGGASPIVSLAAGKGERSIYVTTEGGVLWQLRAGSWEQVGTGVHFPTFPG